MRNIILDRIAKHQAELEKGRHIIATTQATVMRLEGAIMTLNDLLAELDAAASIPASPEN
jgi:hypothetical protein